MDQGWGRRCLPTLVNAPVLGPKSETREGTALDCLKRVHPRKEIDNCFEDKEFAEAMAFGATCLERVEGEGPYFTVDNWPLIETFKNDPEIYNLLIATP